MPIDIQYNLHNVGCTRQSSSELGSALVGTTF